MERRTFTKAVAWTAPAVVVAGVVPAYAGSADPAPTPPGLYVHFNGSLGGGNAYTLAPDEYSDGTFAIAGETSLSSSVLALNHYSSAVRFTPADLPIEGFTAEMRFTPVELSSLPSLATLFAFGGNGWVRKLDNTTLQYGWDGDGGAAARVAETTTTLPVVGQPNLLVVRFYVYGTPAEYRMEVVLNGNELPTVGPSQTPPAIPPSVTQPPASFGNDIDLPDRNDRSMRGSIDAVAFNPDPNGALRLS